MFSNVAELRCHFYIDKPRSCCDIYKTNVYSLLPVCFLSMLESETRNDVGNSVLTILIIFQIPSITRPISPLIMLTRGAIHTRIYKYKLELWMKCCLNKHFLYKK